MIKDMQINEAEEGIIDVITVIDKETVSKSYQESAQKVQAKATLKGFRPGKAPLNLVEKVYESEIRYETMNTIFPTVYEKMTKEHNVSPIATPEISGYENFIMGEDLTLKLKVETAPYVKTLGDISTIKATQVLYSYDEADLLEKELDALAQIHATYNNLVGAVKEGDFVQVAYSIDSEDFKRGETMHYVMVKRNDPQFEFTSKLIGKNLGETTTETITFSSVYVEQELADKTVNITMTPIEGRTIQMPPIDDELAKKFHFETLDELKEEIRAILKKRAEMKGLYDSASNVFEELAKISTFSIGEKVILSQTQHQLQKKLQDIMKQGAFEEYSKDKGFSDEGFIAEVRADAKKSIGEFLVNQEFVKQWNITADSSELEGFIQEISQQEISNRKEIIDYYNQNPTKKEDLKSQLLTKKVAQEIAQKVTFTSTETKTMEHQALGA